MLTQRKNRVPETLMKILIISDAWLPQVNGVVRTYEHLNEELRKRGHQVDVIGPSDFPVRVPMPGYPEIKLALGAYRQLKTMIDEYAPDHIHIATEGPLGWAARKYCLRHACNFTSSYHTQFPDYVAKRLARRLPFLFSHVHEMAKRFVRHFHKPAGAMLIATQSLEDELRSWKFEAPIFRLTRGVHTDLFYPGEKTLFNDLPRPVALCVGRVAIEKNLEAFLEMDWHGSKVIVGDGPSMSELQRKYPDAIFVGTKEGEELAAHYRSADIFVFPSRTDTFGIVLIEALASGLPVAAYNVMGPKDIITEPFLGVLHENDLGWAARKALESGTPEERSQYVKKVFTWENAARQFEIIAQKVV